MSGDEPGKRREFAADPDHLRGRSREEIEAMILGHWIKELAAGREFRYRNPDRRGEQIRVMEGHPNDRNPFKRGPYARITKDGQVSDPIPLRGNPAL